MEFLILRVSLHVKGRVNRTGMGDIHVHVSFRAFVSCHKHRAEDGPHKLNKMINNCIAVNENTPCYYVYIAGLYTLQIYKYGNLTLIKQIMHYIPISANGHRFTRRSSTSNQKYFAGCNLHYGPIGNFFAGLTDRDRKKERERKGDRNL